MGRIPLTLPAVGTACLREVPAKDLDIMVAAIAIRCQVFRSPRAVWMAEWGELMAGRSLTSLRMKLRFGA